MPVGLGDFVSPTPSRLPDRELRRANPIVPQMPTNLLDELLLGTARKGFLFSHSFWSLPNRGRDCDRFGNEQADGPAVLEIRQRTNCCKMNNSGIILKNPWISRITGPPHIDHGEISFISRKLEKSTPCRLTPKRCGDKMIVVSALAEEEAGLLWFRPLSLDSSKPFGPGVVK